MRRRAKIVATVGPASSEPGVLARLLTAGVDVVRLNLSHGSHDDHRRALQRVREWGQENGRHIPVIVDLMGPRYRLGELTAGPRSLRRGERVTLGEAVAGIDLPIPDPELIDHIRKGERILIDNGLVEIRVEAKRRGRITARVVTGGQVASRKGINLPDTQLPFAVSDKDLEDIEFAVREGADYLAASYVGTAADLEVLRGAIHSKKGRLPLVAKLERATAVEHLEELADAAEALMVARGDLGVEVPLHQVPVLQKRIIQAGRALGKPVIVATQMLESMMEHPRPTRAESSDVANAVFDGADALMLSGETAAGRYPVEAVQTMVRIVEEAERHLAGETSRAGRSSVRPCLETTEAPRSAGDRPSETTSRRLSLAIANTVSAAAVFATQSLETRLIVAFSQGGFTARMIARYRPEVPILVFTTDRRVARRIQLVWGVRPLVMETEADHHDEVVEVVDRQLLAARLARPGDLIIILMGDPIRERPLTNLMRLHRVRKDEVRGSQERTSRA